MINDFWKKYYGIHISSPWWCVPCTKSLSKQGIQKKLFTRISNCLNTYIHTERRNFKTFRKENYTIGLNSCYLLNFEYGTEHVWKHIRERLVSAVSQKKQKFSYNFSLVGIKSMAYFRNSIYLDPYCPLYSHLFPNIPAVKSKKVEFFHYLNCIKSLSSHLVSMYEQ